MPITLDRVQRDNALIRAYQARIAPVLAANLADRSAAHYAAIDSASGFSAAAAACRTDRRLLDEYFTAREQLQAQLGTDLEGRPARHTPAASRYLVDQAHEYGAARAVATTAILDFLLGAVEQ